MSGFRYVSTLFSLHKSPDGLNFLPLEITNTATRLNILQYIVILVEKYACDVFLLYTGKTINSTIIQIQGTLLS